MELVLGRVMYPYQLAEEHKRHYMQYLKEHWTEAACYIVKKEDIQSLRWLTENLSYDNSDLKMAIEAANRKGNVSAVSLLMNLSGSQEKAGRRRFVL